MMNGIQTNFTAPPPAGWGHFLKRPIEYSRYLLSPTDNPSTILRRIHASADKAIQKAKRAGLTVEDRSPQINDEINHTLQQHRVIVPNRAPEVGLVADLAPFENNPEVTRAIPLQDRVDQITWKERQKQYQKKLTEKLTVFTALCQMRNYAGIEDTDNLKLLGLVKQATEGTNPVSVWELFTKRYNDLTIFQKICSAFFYWCFYQTSLVQNTIDAYLGAFIDRTTKDITTKESETRTKVFRALIENANDFLNEDIKATKIYANEQAEGLLKDIRNKAIERSYGSSFETLCEQFSSSVVEEDPRVKIFEEFQNIPFIGLAFWGFEWVVNKLIIQRTMKNIILPKALESAVSGGLAATQPDKLPFAISLTRFFTSQLEQLSTKIENGGEDLSQPTEVVAGTELLRATIELTIQALALEGEYTPLELRKKIANFESGRDGIVRRTILPEIVKGITDAGNTLFSYLNETIESGELFARFLDLSLAPFEGEEKTPEMLKAEFEQETLTFEETAAAVFKTLVRKAVTGDSGKENSEAIYNAAQEAHRKQTVIATELLSRMEQICTRMETKIEASGNAPTEENSIQSDLVALLQIMQMFHSRKEFKDQLEKIDNTHRNEIWRKINTLFKKIEEMQIKTIELQDLSNQYPRDASVIGHLNELKTILTMVQNQFAAQPRQRQNPPLESIKRMIEEVTKSLGADAPISRHLGATMREVTELSTHVTEEQNVIDAIFALYPPQGEEGDRRLSGLLDQLLDYQRGTQPYGFKPRDCLQTIAKYLAHLPAEEKRDLERIIGNGANIESKWEELGAVLQRIYVRHMQRKHEYSEQLNQFLNREKLWLDNTLVEYNHYKLQDHEKMKGKMDLIKSDLRTLSRDARKLHSHLTTPLSNRILETLTASPLLAGLYVGSWPFAAAGAIASSAAYKYLRPHNHSNEDFIRSTVKKAGLVGAVGLASCYAPGLLTSILPLSAGKTVGAVATGALLGTKTVEAVKSWVVDKTFNEVWDIFTKAYAFSRNTRVYKAASTRMMKAMVTES